MTEYQHENDLFSSRSEGDLVVVGMKRPVVDFATDLHTKEAFFSHLATVSRSPSVKALLLLHSRDALSDERYRSFIQNTLIGRSSKKRDVHDTDLLREENALSQYILTAATFRKLLISCLQGATASPFFGAHLASDIRIVSDDFVVEMSHIALGIPPDGGLGFFLPRYVGQGRATEILLSGEPLPATRALELGLVNAVVPSHDFEQNCLDAARKYLTIPAATIHPTKEIFFPFAGELEKYLAAELSAVLRGMGGHL